MSLISEVKAALAASGLSPLHRLGQNFMVDPSAVAAVVDAVGAGPGVRIAEIGPGTGILTRRFLAAGSTVLAVELDRGLAGHLETALVPEGLQLVHGDALASKNRLHPALEAFASTEEWRLGANLPYDVALPVILNAAALPKPPERIVVTIQYEAARRLCSRPGDDAWGATAAVLQAGGMPKLVRKLGPGCFHPQPRVDSAILAWRPERPIPDGFGRFCRTLFAFRRKVLPGALRDAGIPKETALVALVDCGLDAGRRVEQLDAAELTGLFTRLLVLLGENRFHAD